MKEIILYGIPNCDTTKKAIEWLKKNKSIFIFHNYKQQGISKEKLLEWDTKVGWDSFFNKRSTSWRALPKEEQDSIKNLSAVIKIMQENNSITALQCRKATVLQYYATSSSHYAASFSQSISVTCSVVVAVFS